MILKVIVKIYLYLLFSPEKLSSVMEAAGLKTERCVYIQRATINKKEGVNVPRIFVQGKFVKPASCSASFICEHDEIADTLASKCSVIKSVTLNDEHSLKNEDDPDSSVNSTQRETSIR